MQQWVVCKWLFGFPFNVRTDGRWWGRRRRCRSHHRFIQRASNAMLSLANLSMHSIFHYLCWMKEVWLHNLCIFVCFFSLPSPLRCECSGDVPFCAHWLTINNFPHLCTSVHCLWDYLFLLSWCWIAVNFNTIFLKTTQFEIKNKTTTRRRMKNYKSTELSSIENEKKKKEVKWFKIKFSNLLARSPDS